MKRGRKASGGKYHKQRKSRLYELKGQERKVSLRETKRKKLKGRGGNIKTILLNTNVANLVSDGKIQKVEIKNVRNAITQGNLHELVEKRVRTKPELTAILRNLDFKHYNFLEERTPITRKSKLIATTKEALFRPEIKRFQERVINRYKKPESVKILLLLSCSAKKPYSFSKSHRLYKEKIDSSNNPFLVHEVVITSPIGLVPKELELLYPASTYDIPITGIWEENEKKN